MGAIDNALTTPADFLQQFVVAKLDRQIVIRAAQRRIGISILLVDYRV
jgi:hypothetical protein